jgi:hypothetical protein
MRFDPLVEPFAPLSPPKNPDAATEHGSAKYE